MSQFATSKSVGIQQDIVLLSQIVTSKKPNSMGIILIFDYFGISLQQNNCNNETSKDFSAVYLDCECAA